MMERLDAFRHAIAWSEPFIIGLVVFQIVMFALTLYVGRRGFNSTIRIALLIFVFVIVRAAEYLNTWGAHEWESFATQNYFDRQGLFIAIFWCAPLLVDAFIMLVMFLLEAAQLLVQVKTAQIKQKQRDAKATQRRKKKDQ